MKLSTNFNKLTEKDNWSYKTYYLGDDKLDESSGGVVDVLWPDGTTETLDFISKYNRVAYQDQGRTCDGGTYQLYVEVFYHGYYVRVPLEVLDIANVRQD